MMHKQTPAFKKNYLLFLQNQLSALNLKPGELPSWHTLSEKLKWSWMKHFLDLHPYAQCLPTNTVPECTLTALHVTPTGLKPIAFSELQEKENTPDAMYLSWNNAMTFALFRPTRKDLIDALWKVVQYAKDQGWRGIHIVSATPDVQSILWMNAQHQGLNVSGYSPNDDDRRKLNAFQRYAVGAVIDPTRRKSS